MPTFAFRVDASIQIGTGHVIRCVTLANELRNLGSNCIFITRKCEGNLIEYIKKKKFQICELEISTLGDHIDKSIKNLKKNDNVYKSSELDVDAQETLLKLKRHKIDWLIVDHYQIDFTWESKLRTASAKIMVIDDLANRLHDCDLLLDQNLRINAEKRYKSLIPKNCTRLFGPRNVILHPSFDKGTDRVRDGKIKHILVYFGGYDIHNQALNVLKALQNFPQITAEVVLGASHPYREQVHAYAQANIVVSDLVDMAESMRKADLAIGVCGIAAWERCSMGLPSLVCINANNQIEDSENLHRLGAIECLGLSAEVGAVDWYKAVLKLMNNPSRILFMGENAKEVVKGHSINRQILLNHLFSKGPIDSVVTLQD